MAHLHVTHVYRHDDACRVNASLVVDVNAGTSRMIVVDLVTVSHHEADVDVVCFTSSTDHARGRFEPGRVHHAVAKTAGLRVSVRTPAAHDGAHVCAKNLGSASGWQHPAT